MSDEWEPDFVFSAKDELGRYTTVYLDGEKVRWCYEARVKWESFERPTFGELIVASTRDGNRHLAAVFNKPHLGEMVIDGALFKFVAGRVLIELDEKGKTHLEQLRSAIGWSSK